VKTAAVLALLLLLTACSEAGGDAPTATQGTESASPTATPTHPADPTPEEIVGDSHARLVSVKVRRTPAGLHVAAWWRVDNGDATGAGGAIVESSDDFATSRARTWTEAWYDERRQPLDVPGLEGLMQQPTTSFARGVRAVSGGSDGATLFPFEAMARSTDGGVTWRTYDVARVDDARAYSSGEVVLPDGRVLALLDHWSDDRNGHPSDRPHGLYASSGDDWSHYSPYPATFRPALKPAPRGWPPVQSLQASAGRGGVVWMTTYDGLVYASTDGARTFREIRVR
jgi:hypothetical protein